MKRKNLSRHSGATSLSRRTFLKGTAGAMAILGAPAFIKNAGASKLRKVKYQLAWIPSGQFASAFVAQELGFWSKRGLDVQIDRGFGSAQGATNVAAGAYEIAEVSFSAAVVTASKGGALLALGARYQKSPIGVIALKKAGIRKPKDLEGKTAATTAGSGSTLLFPAFARAAGIDPNKVKLEFVTGPALNASVMAGKVDAALAYYVSSAPNFQGRDMDFDYIFFADYGLDTLDQVWITRPKRFQEDKELFRNFVQGALEGVKYSYLNPERSVQITMEKLPLYGASKESRRLIDLGLGAATALGISSYVEKNGLGWMESSLVKDSVDKTIRYMGAAPIQDVERLYTNEFIGTVKLASDEWVKVKEYAKKYFPS